MLAVVLHVFGFTDSLLASIPVHNFSLVTDKGENVFQADFYRRRLAVGMVDRLALKFNAEEKQFEFELESSHPIFAPGATIKITGRVRAHKKTHDAITSHVLFAHMRAHAQGNDDLEVSPPETLSYFSAQNDAAITFINRTTLNGVVFQHSRAFNIVASADFLVVQYCTSRMTPQNVIWSQYLYTIICPNTITHYGTVTC